MYLQILKMLCKWGITIFTASHLLFQFCFGFFSKTIQVNIIDDEEYEKNKNFFIELGEPRLLEMSERKGVRGCLTSLE